ncbi:glycosyltransferase [uncultured Oceanisphaera sp.]|uniref:glycosyltransferase n=1 Tax=uncultured Oceanisphaera sp. TaxID=353858 RepID=UPI0026364732|nr:glycosyltransferase [uncultured Oceanisphaera sp.]
MFNNAQLYLEGAHLCSSPTEDEIISNWKGDINKPIVSICCITYNHKDYVGQAISSFLMQKTEFPFEVLIHDDASIDGAIDVIRMYAEKYPKIIRLIVQEENQYSKGVRLIAPRFLFPISKGKYIALCEGDDFWTDCNKLQKQYSFLENNLEYQMHTHLVDILDSTCNKKAKSKYSKVRFGTHDFKSVLKNQFIPTLSIFCRNEFVDFLDYFDGPIRSGDKAIALFNASKGLCFFSDEAMGVYREHDGGVTKTRLCFESYLRNTYALYKGVNLLTACKFKKEVDSKLAEDELLMAKQALINNKMVRFFELLFSSLKNNPFVIFNIIMHKLG